MPFRSNPRKILFIGAFFASILFAFALVQSCSNFGSSSSANFTNVTTVARLNNEFAEPFGVAVKESDFYVADGQNGRIWRFDGSSPTILTENLDTPSSIAFDSVGNLIVADSGSNTIKSINAKGEVSTLAGIESLRGNTDGDALLATFNAPVGIAASPSGKIYVTDTYNDRIRVIEKGKVTTLAGSSRGFADGAQAQFDTPLGLSIWGERLLVADSGNRRIRVVEPDGSVWTLAGNGDGNLQDGLPMLASFVRPTAITVSHDGTIYVADGNAIRTIGRRILPFVETITDGRRGFRDGTPSTAQFNRPSGLAFDNANNLLVADSDNGLVRKFTGEDKQKTAKNETVPSVKNIEPAQFRELRPPRWPFDPPDAKRDIAGTLGEIRGEVVDENSQVWFHNGLDIAGAYGETARFIRSEKVLHPNAVENFADLRELIRMPTLGYIHLRLGRDKDDKPFGDSRFLFEKDSTGKLASVRIPRGTKFQAGEPLGTLNAMNHVHLIAGRSGGEMNALDALVLPGILDTIAPTIENVMLYDENWQPIETKTGAGRIKLVGKTRIVVRAYDRMDGNPERRRLGVYRLGYSTTSEPNWTISFDRMPSYEAVKTAYAPGSKSGATGETIFNYIVTNRVSGENFRQGFLDPTAMQPGMHTIRVFAADFFGNVSSKDISIEVIK